MTKSVTLDDKVLLFFRKYESSSLVYTDIRRRLQLIIYFYEILWDEDSDFHALRFESRSDTCEEQSAIQTRLSVLFFRGTSLYTYSDSEDTVIELEDQLVPCLSVIVLPQASIPTFELVRDFIGR